MNIRGAVALCAAAVLLLTACTRTDAPDAAAKAGASEAAKLRSEVPTTVPTTESTAPVNAPVQPAALARNPIYRAGKLPSPNCAEPELEPTSLRNVRAYYADFVACLNEAWAPVIRKAGFTFTPPKLDVVLGKSPSSPCHFYDGPAYYCGDTIYLDAQADLDGYEDDPETASTWMAVTIVHEYGHHVQALTGILAATYKRGITLNGIELHQEESRRVELQADCFGGAYLGADAVSFPADDDWREIWEEVVRSTEDPDHDHGSVASFGLWSEAGFDAGGPGACNTYTADSALVG
ncbi:neutral zinc metallopeptidase [Kribbella sp. NPDC026596]|uniref:neutral zinc metallopeptidase n=1 Tax=Kribbella sp. NPDC026596 TaxID=3155122 RepID=UPI0033F50EDD